MTTKKAANPGAALGKLGASKGGQARAARLTAAERSESARAAAEARWGSVAEATHAGELLIAHMSIECAVLDDGTRVLSQGTMLKALGRAPTSGRQELTDRRPPFLAAANLVPYIGPDLVAMYEPIQYRLPGGSNVTRMVGYRAEILPMVCEVYLDAAQDNAILRSQRIAARAADILLRGLARVGITALVDEATGYQEVRARQELQAILEAYVQAEFRPWIKTFPDDFFRQVYRLQGWEFKPGTSKRTPMVGKLIKHYIYAQLPQGVLEELERVNPKNENGNRARRHHQFLTESTGNVHLDRQISTVTTLMRMAEDRQEFEAFFDRAFPPVQGRLPLVVDVEPGNPDDPTPRRRIVS
jgi:hypothetical protein